MLIQLLSSAVGPLFWIAYTVQAHSSLEFVCLFFVLLIQPFLGGNLCDLSADRSTYFLSWRRKLRLWCSNKKKITMYLEDA